MKIINIIKKCRYNENDININELNEIRRINRESILLDVRSAQEYNEGHLRRCNKYTIVRIGSMLRNQIRRKRQDNNSILPKWN